jgi:hypothetical protein
MFLKIAAAALCGVIVFDVARISDAAMLLLDLGWLVLAALLHFA